MKDYRVLLVNPPHLRGLRFSREGRCAQSSKIWRTVWPPFSLASIAAVLEKEKIMVKICDCPAQKLNLNHFLSVVEEYKPQTAIINTATPSIESDLTISSLLKRYFPQIKIVVFGIHVSVLPEESFRMSESIDFIIHGEPEFTARELIISLCHNLSFNEIKGLSWRLNGEVVHNEDREFIADLDELPMPAWHLVDISRYRLPLLRKPYLIISPARGCYHQCIFCAAHSYYGHKRRNRSVKYVIEEIKICQRQFNVENFLFWTEDFTSDREYLDRLLSEMIKSRLKIKWVCNSRIDTVDFELLKKMKLAGCWMISFGIESGNQHILNRIKKEITLDQIRKTITLTKKAGIEIVTNCLFGLPEETKQTINRTIQFVKELDPTFAQFYCAVPRPGAEFYNLARERKWINTSSWAGFHQEKSILDINSLKATEIMKLRKKALVKFYCHPKTIWKMCRLYINLFRTS